MPNWIENEIIIKAKTSEEIAEWLNSGVKETPDSQYTFNSWVPMPETYRKYDTTNNSVDSLRKRLGEKIGFSSGEIITEDLIKEYEEAISYQQRTYGAVGWYDWSCRYWGTKWDSDLDIQCYKNSAIIYTSTAWSPPLAFYVQYHLGFQVSLLILKLMMKVVEIFTVSFTMELKAQILLRLME